jgi:hypothetical protein
MDFLRMEPNEWFGKIRTSEMEKALLSNVMKRLMHQTYVNIDREIISKRMGVVVDIQ